MLKYLRQLADSGWFGSNWNTRDWEWLRDLPLRCGWNIHEHVARTYHAQSSSVFSVARENLAFPLSISFLEPLVSWYRNKGRGWSKCHVMSLCVCVILCMCCCACDAFNECVHPNFGDFHIFSWTNQPKNKAHLPKIGRFAVYGGTKGQKAWRNEITNLK